MVHFGAGTLIEGQRDTAVGQGRISGSGTLLWGRDTPHKAPWCCPVPVSPCLVGNTRNGSRATSPATSRHRTPPSPQTKRFAPDCAMAPVPEPEDVGQSPGGHRTGSSVPRGAPGGRAGFARSQPVLPGPGAAAGTGRGRLEARAGGIRGVNFQPRRGSRELLILARCFSCQSERLLCW